MRIGVQIRNHHGVLGPTTGEHGQQKMFMSGPRQPGIGLTHHIALPRLAISGAHAIRLLDLLSPHQDLLVRRELLLMNQLCSGLHELHLSEIKKP